MPLLAAVRAHAAVQFTVTNLGTLGGSFSTAHAINASGQVAGSASRADGTVRATRWTNGIALNLDVPFGNNSAADGTGSKAYADPAERGASGLLLQTPG